MAEMSREYRIVTESIDKKVRFVKSTYPDGSLRLTLYTHTYDNNGYHWYEEYADFTKDIEASKFIRSPYQAFVNPAYGEMIYDWMASKGIGNITDTEVWSGFYAMILVDFDHKFIDRLEEFDGDLLPGELGVKSKNASKGFAPVEVW